MKKIIIHGGLHKTGTTSFQSRLIENREAFAQQGIFSALPGEKRGERHAIPRSFREDRESNTSNMLERTIASFEKSDCHTLILSSEGFSMLLKHELQAFIEQIPDYEKIGILVFRHPIAHLTSTFCSRGAFVGKRPMPFVKNTLAAPRSSAARILNDWIDLFGREKLYALRYENHISIPDALSEKTGFALTTETASIRSRKSLPVDAAMLNARLFFRYKPHMAPVDHQKRIYNALLNFADSESYKKFSKDMPKYGILSIDDQEKVLSQKNTDLAFVEDHIEPALKATSTPYTFPVPGIVPSDDHIDRLEALFWIHTLPQIPSNYFE